MARSGGRGPAAARNVGWRHAHTEWVAFLDDDVLVEGDWFARLADDLVSARPEVAGIQGRLRVPLPAGRRPTDWERGTAGLETARWITADMVYRRSVLSAVGGFDERFPRAFREDADLALRILDAGHELGRGSRGVLHPVRPSDAWASVRAQRGNADDVLMRRLHGSDWRERAGASKGRRARHLAVTAVGVVALGSVAARALKASPSLNDQPKVHDRLRLWGVGGWAAGTAEFALRRIAPGPRDAAEIGRMLATSVAIPPAATWHFLAGLARHRRAQPWQGPPELVLFDRDGTLVVDVPYNGDPGLVRPVAGAEEALDALRAAGIRVGVVSNQSGIARGVLTHAQVASVNARIEELLGPFETWQYCPHRPDDGCACRKPAPGMVKEACALLGVDPSRAAVVGDIGADVEAATAAGARGVLVPTEHTLTAEVAAAPELAFDLRGAVALLLRGAG